MTDVPYSNRELDRIAKDLEERSVERHRDVMKELSEIKVQTLRTNGRVNKLEMWRALTTGAIIIISTVVIPLVVYAFNTKTAQ